MAFLIVCTVGKCLIINAMLVIVKPPAACIAIFVPTIKATILACVATVLTRNVEDLLCVVAKVTSILPTKLAARCRLHVLMTHPLHMYALVMIRNVLCKLLTSLISCSGVRDCGRGIRAS